MGLGGAEAALIELLKRLDPAAFDVSLYVMLGQGELIGRVPPHVKRLNRRFDARSVLSAQGRRALRRHALGLVLRRGALLRNAPCIARSLRAMRRAGRVQPDKLLWRAISDGTPERAEVYDVAVAWLEGAATYYVGERVRAGKKVAFVHVDYGLSGYTGMQDRNVYRLFDQICCVSAETRDAFLRVHPDAARKTEVFHNIIPREAIRLRAGEPGGFDDGWRGVRIVTLARLTPQKAVEVSVAAMALLRDAGVEARWYVFGEGEERARLEADIRRRGLEDRFFLPGALENPYPWLAQADIYAHCTRYEGRSIALQEAQALGRAIVASDCSGNRESVADGVDGLLTPLSPEAISAAIRRLIDDPALRRRLGLAAAGRVWPDGAEEFQSYFGK